MSFFWIFIYILFVIFVLTFFFWNIVILQRQKQTWKAFAKKHSLIVREAGFMDAAAIEGLYKKHRIGIFSEGRVDERHRGMVRYQTVIEFVLGHGMPCKGALGNHQSYSVIESLRFGTPYYPEKKGWDKNNIITCSNQNFIKAYLTNKRLDRMNAFFNMQKANAMMVFDETSCFLRVETMDPMIDMDKLETFLNKLASLSKDMQLSAEEQTKWLAENAPGTNEKITS